MKKDDIYDAAVFVVALCTVLNLSTNVYVNGYETHGWDVSYLAGHLFVHITFINITLTIYSIILVYHENRKTSNHHINTQRHQVFSGLLLFVTFIFISPIVFPHVLKLDYPLHMPLIATLLQSVLIFRVVCAQADHVQRADPLLLVAKDGTERVIAANATPFRARDENSFGTVPVLQDSTEKRRVEEELIEADKLDSIGLLAGGIAHDFNNMLTAIIGNIALAKMYANREDKVFARLINAEKAALQAQNLTQQLLTISKQGTPVRQPAAIDHLIRDCIDFSLRGSNVTCTFHANHTLWPVDIDQGQISQVINNLIINADQAMPDGGHIDVDAHNATIDTQHIDRYPALEPGRYVKILVKDNGSGISEAHLSKIFDPYFTTKQTGNGLGLFTCYAIIKKHRGHLSVTSQQGVGTTFTVYLPAAAQRVAPQPGIPATPYPGKGNILIMEDDETIRDVTGEMLGYLGYEVTFARDGAEAIALYRQGKHTDTPFEAVVLDLTVPGGMGGKQAIKKLLRIDPHTRAIVASGYSNDPIMAQFERYGFCDRIVKPYNSEALHAVLQRVIKTRYTPLSRPQRVQAGSKPSPV